MLVQSNRLFYFNKTVETVDDVGRRHSKTYWRCTTKGCGGSACTSMDDEGREEVKMLRDHDSEICEEDESKVIRRDKRNKVMTRHSLSAITPPHRSWIA